MLINTSLMAKTTIYPNLERILEKYEFWSLQECSWRSPNLVNGGGADCGCQ